MARDFLGSRMRDRVEALARDLSVLRYADAPEASGVEAFVGTIGARRVVLAATDPSRASGAIGRQEAARLIAAVREAREHRLPLVLILDSAGAMLTEGVRVLGAFRRLQLALMEARADGIPLAVVIGRNCFGGASLLAFTADVRIYPRGCRLGLSGPRALAALHARRLSDAEIAGVFGCESRARHDEDAVLVTDNANAVHSVLAAWLAQPAAPADSLGRARRLLTRRLRMYRGDPFTLSTQAPPPELEARLDHLFPQGWSAVFDDGVVWGDGWLDGRDTCFAGFVSGTPVGVFQCWRLAEVLSEFTREPSGTPVTVLLDSPGQQADIESEQLVLSEFVTRVAEALQRLRLQGRTVELWMLGQAGGAIYVALAAAASSVTAWPGLRLQTLPAAAVDGVVGEVGEARPTLSALLEARVIDRWTRSPGFGTSAPTFPDTP